MSKTFVYGTLVGLLSLCSTGIAQAASLPSAFAAHLAAMGIRDLGRADASRRLEITVSFQHSHAGELAALIAEQSSRTSPLRGRYLTPAQFDAYFAPAPATVAAVTRALRSGGFVPESGSFTGSTRRYAGTARSADAMFGTEIHAVAQPGFGMRYATVRPPAIPAAIASAVVAVNGFDDLSVRPISAVRPAIAAGAKQPIRSASETGDRPQPSAAANGACVGKATPSTVDVDTPIPAQDSTVGYSPGTFESDFDLPVEHGCGGTSVAIGIVGSAEPAASDVAQYYSTFGVKRTLPTYTLRQATGPATNGDVGEATLDIDLVSALAPQSPVVFYDFDETASGLVASLNLAAADNTVSVMSVSYIYCEVVDAGATSIASNSVLQQLAAQGITVAASTGDTGYENCFGNPGVGAPASSPYAVAVGGVGPSPTGVAYRGSLVGWSGSTGGTSQYLTKGLYQTGIKACSTANRCLPDLALASGIGTFPIASTATQGALIFFDGQPNAFSGTSASAPIFSAMQAEVDQFAGRRMGFVNPLLYADYYLLGSTMKSDPLQIFQDVASGNNGEPATAGWDFVTGLGVPSGEKLARVEALI